MDAGTVDATVRLADLIRSVRYFRVLLLLFLCR